MRSPSVKPSMRSSSSRFTLVGYDATLEPRMDVMDGTTNDVKDYDWSGHLLAVFCIPRRRKNKHFQKISSIARREPEDREIHLDSPWVLPVYVLSTERDEHRHLVPKEAKCTIDTGNLQGNIVSRAFLVDVLGYSETNFLGLTKEEEIGATGITGHRLIPEGAICLTWYHSNSTRVFRDMRFLVSEHPNYDIIIGAHSIRQNNILDVPNLMGDLGGPGGKALFDAGPNTEEIKKLESKMIQAKEDWQGFRLEGWKKINPKPTPEKKKELIGAKKKIYDEAKELYDNERRAEYKNLIRRAEKKHEKDKAAKLRDEYKGWFGEVLPTPLPEEERPKTD